MGLIGKQRVPSSEWLLDDAADSGLEKSGHESSLLTGLTEECSIVRNGGGIEQSETGDHLRSETVPLASEDRLLWSLGVSILSSTPGDCSKGISMGSRIRAVGSSLEGL